MREVVFVLIFAMAMTSCKFKKEETAQVIKEPNEVPEIKDESGWMTLFDGTSYEHWRGYLQEDMPTQWGIEDGAMVFTPGEKHGNNIITKQKFESFVLSLEWKISEGGNSGFFWGVHEDKNLKEAYQTGPEIQILDNDRHPDAKANPKFHQAGALYDMVQPSQDVCKPAGKWNTCVLKIDHGNNQGKVTLNGTEIAEFPVHGESWNNLVASSKFKDWEYFGKFQIGHIGLQDHGDKVWFRNVKIKELN